MPALNGRPFLGPLIAIAIVPATLLLLEGAYSLWTRESLVDRLLERGALPPAPAPVRERNAGAALTEGPYALDEDQDVVFRMKASTTADFGVEARTDAFGDRVRIGSPPEPGATRIVVLGDSVAFGHGVADDETFAHGLEQFLAQTLDPAHSRPFVRTVACPGWTYTSSFRYLQNHFERLAPEIVLYVAVLNDLDDSTAVNELGWRSMDIDPSPDRPQGGTEGQTRLIKTLQHAPSRAAGLQVLRAGGRRVLDHVLRSGITPESRRRWKLFLEDLRALHDDLAARGTRFAVVLPFDQYFHRLLEIRLAELAPEIPVLGLVAGRVPEDTLGDDPHANARCLLAGAWRMADFLIERDWVPGAGAQPLPPQDEMYRERGYAFLAPTERAPYLERETALLERFLGNAIDLEQVVGIHQVYGGLVGDGTVGKHVFAALRTEGADHLSLTLERLPAASAVYPLALSIELQGRALARFDVPPPAEGEDPRIVFDASLPDDLEGPYVDVLVRASNWVLRESVAGQKPTSFLLRRLALDGR